MLAGHLLHAAMGEPTHRHQLARERSPLSLLGLTHQLEQLTVTASFEHIFDYRPPGGHSGCASAPVWMNCSLGITSVRCRPSQVSPWLSAWFLFFFTCVLSAIRAVEERHLRRRFGADYEEYLRRVPRWIPRLTVWESDRTARV